MGELLRLMQDDDGLRLVREPADDGVGVEMVEMEGVLRTGGGGLWPWEPDLLRVPLGIEPTPEEGNHVKTMS